VGFNPDHSAFNLPEVNQQLDKLKLPNTVLFDRSSRGNYSETSAQIAQNKTMTTEVERHTITLAGLFTLGACQAHRHVNCDQNFIDVSGGKPLALVWSSDILVLILSR